MLFDFQDKKFFVIHFYLFVQIASFSMIEHIWISGTIHY